MFPTRVGKPVNIISRQVDVTPRRSARQIIGTARLASIFRGAWLGRAERAGCWLVGLVVAGGCGKSPGVAAVGRAFLRPVGSFVS